MIGENAIFKNSQVENIHMPTYLTLHKQASEVNTVQTLYSVLHARKSYITHLLNQNHQ